jgi:hypothetical protein
MYELSAKQDSKNVGESTIVLWRMADEKNNGRIPTFRDPNQNIAALWQILAVRQTIGRKDSIQTVF